MADTLTAPNSSEFSEDSTNNRFPTPPVVLRQPRRSELEEMNAGNLYNPADPELAELRTKAHVLCAAYNSVPENDGEQRATILQELMPNIGKDCDIVGPVFCDYGFNIIMGDRCFANFNFNVLDVCPVTIGNDVLFGPNVSIMTPLHPLRWKDRNVRKAEDGSAYDYEYGAPVTIGSNCWFGSNVTVLAGVTIGDGCVIGAGSVVTRHIPRNTIAVGNPARVLREITNEDASTFQKYAQ